MGTEGSCGAGNAGTPIHTPSLAEVDNEHALKYRHAPTRQHGKKQKVQIIQKKTWLASSVYQNAHPHRLMWGDEHALKYRRTQRQHGKPAIKA
jgi:hypothetical protein